MKNYIKRDEDIGSSSVVSSSSYLSPVEHHQAVRLQTLPTVRTEIDTMAEQTTPRQSPSGSKKSSNMESEMPPLRRCPRTFDEMGIPHHVDSEEFQTSVVRRLSKSLGKKIAGTFLARQHRTDAHDREGDGPSVKPGKEHATFRLHANTEATKPTDTLLTNESKPDNA
ncbi:hypothetical protein N656DRAFT_91028 [Canariomyces notabilis]|uniref:Uncharacterized protein n=1 Tax=Canariomyces notabilis TaxID=2074819 RepID=A0AAN6YT72_9PEZI|nr:hypothetical protein N656DRAFT_91028 [Canariomyces arenarius]